ncbi:hypothetical protein [Frigoriglobus tundricola]|uniref:Uncharacterized protein n=1 Tax=Frigoriglobus tundricola TaxID=2774151 RepID=A0A6M5YJB5_9BACT|nr:hypothetical protein [Frigoriglobus tundricola]QJW94147.1 hypothetical protein FTUN_1666 [Frigoriglobus tundricola]
MRREECVELFKRIPEEYHPQINFILRNQAVLSVDQVARFEPLYVAFRGREGGTTDEGRAFFVPYEEISYFRLERIVKLGDLKLMYGETGYVDAEDRLSAGTEKKEAAEAKLKVDAQTPQPAAASSTTLPQDPASIAKQNLLDRIRATRASVAGSASKIAEKK